MKRLLCVTRASSGEGLLRRVQKLGVMHPEHIRDVGESEELTKLEHKLHVQSTVIHALESRRPEESRESTVLTPPKVRDVERWISDEKRIVEQLSHLDREVARQEVWGNFEPSDVEGLKGNDVYIQLWSMDKNEYAKLKSPSDVHLKEIARDGIVYFATLARGDEISIEKAQPVEIPRHSLEYQVKKRKDLERQLSAASEQLDYAKGYLKEFQSKYKSLSDERDFYETLDRSFEDDKLIAFMGWIPESDVDQITSAIEKEFSASVLEFRDPLPDETPPVKTINTWLARSFEPLMHLLGLPKYRGIDPALFFAPSMMVFFGICLGDAGYGIVMLIIAFLSRKYLAKKVESIIFVSNMTALFGVFTVIWGLLTGTIFGITFKQRSWIALDVSPGMGDPMLLFKIAIGAGIVHLSIALLISIFTSAKLSERFNKLGMLFVIWGGAMGVIKVSYWWMILGLGLIIILSLSADEKNPLKRIGIGLWNIYSLTGLLGDVMSYARLFGLGVASGAIASVVNMLAGDVRGAVPVLGYLLAALVLLIGHAFNFTMGIIGALVHPARLHAVEAFPKCVELTGTPYKPLEKI